MRRNTFVLCFFLGLSGLICALDIPVYDGNFNDKTGFFTPAEQNELKAMLVEIEYTVKTQVAILVIPSTEGENLSDFAKRTLEGWDVGKRFHNNGLLIVLSVEDRKIRLEVGWGLIQELGQEDCRYLLKRFVEPHFRKDRYFVGVYTLLQAIEGILANEIRIKG